MTLRIVHPGAGCLLVDGGRPRSRHLGVPLGGAADRAAWQIANALVGNPPQATALEIALSGPTLLAEADMCLALFGAPFHIERDGKTLPAGSVFRLRRGQTLRIGGSGKGLRAYLAVAGGFAGPVVLGSQSGSPLAGGTVLQCESHAVPLRSLSEATFADLAEFEKTDRLRVLPGPQSDWFDLVAFAGKSFRVSPASNRMGVRLEGDPLPRPQRELTSEAVVPGAIQITNEGLPIILGVDGQTIGGYPKIACVIDADLDRIGQLRPGEEVRFDVVDEKRAEGAREKERERLRLWLLRLGIS